VIFPGTENWNVILSETERNAWNFSLTQKKVEDIGLKNQFGKEANRSAPVFAFYLKFEILNEI
jgi:hypothetical protein